MIRIRLGKGQGLADVASQPLTQGVVPAFHVGGLATFLTHTAMRLLGKNLLVGFPKIAEGLTHLVLIRNLVPQAAAGFLTTIPDHEGHNLARPATNGCPQPPFSVFFQHERPEFIEFEHIAWLGWQQGVLEMGQCMHDYLDPAGDCLPGNIEDALQPTHTGAFFVGPQDGFFLLFCVNALGLQDSIGIAILAVVLSIPTLIRAVPDHVRAATHATVIGYGFLYHAIYDTPSLTFCHYQKEYISEETGEEVILMKDKEGLVIGFEKLNFAMAETEPLQVAFEAMIV